MRHADATPPDSGRLWTSENPRHGVVRHVFVHGNYAGRLDDLNGDYREVCLTLFTRESGTWEPLLSQDDVGYSPHLDDFSTYGSDDPYVWAAGRGRAGGRVAISLFGRNHMVASDPDGWWIFVKRRARPPTHGPGKRGLIIR